MATKREAWCLMRAWSWRSSNKDVRITLSQNQEAISQRPRPKRAMAYSDFLLPWRARVFCCSSCPCPARARVCPHRDRLGRHCCHLICCSALHGTHLSLGAGLAADQPRPDRRVQSLLSGVLEHSSVGHVRFTKDPGGMR